MSNYIKYRPGYPSGVLTTLQVTGNLTTGATIADIGSGTGIFTHLLLDSAYTVYAVEPNDGMRAAANDLLHTYPNYHTINGTAENTTLPPHSIDMITCAQAFHWFNVPDAKIEFSRILKPGGQAALISNTRLPEADDFAIAYEQLWQQQPNDYKNINEQKQNELNYATFFKDGQYQTTTFQNVQEFDEAGLIGRAFSSSFSPAQDSPEGQNFTKSLQRLLARYQINGMIKIHYKTEVFTGGV